MRRPIGYVVLASVILILAIVGAGAYFAGHRAGKGRACFEVALATSDSSGRSLSDLFVNEPGFQWDYSFWGQDCTLSLYTPARHGRWRYDLRSASLFADDDDAVRLFPARGRWQPSSAP